MRSVPRKGPGSPARRFPSPVAHGTGLIPPPVEA